MFYNTGRKKKKINNEMANFAVFVDVRSEKGENLSGAPDVHPEYDAGGISLL